MCNEHKLVLLQFIMRRNICSSFNTIIGDLCSIEVPLFRHLDFCDLYIHIILLIQIKKVIYINIHLIN